MPLENEGITITVKDAEGYYATFRVVKRGIGYEVEYAYKSRDWLNKTETTEKGRQIMLSGDTLELTYSGEELEVL